MVTSLSEQPAVSVIMPVYNGERFVRRGIESVFACGFDSMELLLLDDGSTDGSLEILREYESVYPEKTRVFTHENSGVARTRNRGIELSRGKYILFIDQDDWYDADYINTFYNAIERGGSDIVFGGYRRPDAGGHIVTRRLLSGKAHYPFIAVTSWAKIHRAEFVKSNGILFFDNNIGEDVVFCLHEATLTDKVSFLPYIGYNWYCNEESVSECGHKGLRDDVNVIPLMEKAAGFDFSDARLREYCVTKIPIYYLLHSGRASSPGKFSATYGELFGWLKERFPDFASNPYLLKGLPGERLRVSFPITVFLLLHKVRLVTFFAKLYCRGREVKA